VSERHATLVQNEQAGDKRHDAPLSFSSERGGYTISFFAAKERDLRRRWANPRKSSCRPGAMAWSLAL
jgi:hypothetical protein